MRETAQLSPCVGFYELLSLGRVSIDSPSLNRIAVYVCGLHLREGLLDSPINRVVAKWLTHWTLTPASEGSNPSGPANIVASRDACRH